MQPAAHLRPSVRADHAAVAGGHALEVDAGLAMLRSGGNAVDAVVAAAFMGFVVEPSSCGIGGYGRLSVFLADRRDMVTVDHYLRAPAGVRPDMFKVDDAAPMTYYGFPNTIELQADRGYLAPGVPGAVAGLCAAHEHWGQLPLAQVLEPAIETASAGVPVTWNLLLTIAGLFDPISALPAIAAFLLPRGKLPTIPGQFGGGDRLDTSALARTLRLIADQGAAGFYQGRVAQAIERAVRERGGILTAGDLAAYRPKILREKPATYRDVSYITADDQVGYEALNILETFDLARLGPDSAVFRHLMAEALACAFADNMMHYGDPDHVRSPVSGLASKAFAAQRAQGLNLDAALPRPVLAADPWPFDDAAAAPAILPDRPGIAALDGTSQMAAIDRDGNMATLITSLSGGFGSLVYEPETGVILNNGLRNFDPRPGRANSLAPGKMPIFAAPTIVAVQHDRARFGACGSGGYRIETGVLHTMIHHLDFGMDLRAAIDAPRIHCQGEDTFVDGRIPASTRARLAELGHRLIVQTDHPGLNAFARVAAIAVDPATGVRHAAAGPHWHSAVGGM